MVNVIEVELDGYKDWKAVKRKNLQLPEFSVNAVIQLLEERHKDEIFDENGERDEDGLKFYKGEFVLSCKGTVINYMNEEGGIQWFLVDILT